jgi:hypothetical protein
MESSGEPTPYEAEKFGSSPEVLKGGRRRKSRGKKSRSRKSRGKKRGGDGIKLPFIGGKSRRRKTGRKRR